MIDNGLCGVSKLKTSLFGGTQVKTDYYYKSGKKASKTIYKYGIICSEKVWHPNGKKKRKSTYKNGKLHGKERFWHPNGKMEYEMCYANDIFCGTERYWYSNGNPRMQVPYNKNGQINGEVKHWHPNGIISYACQYSNDQKKGIEKSWDCTYVLIKEDYYIFGELTTREEYRKLKLVEQLSGIGE